MAKILEPFVFKVVKRTYKADEIKMIIPTTGVMVETWFLGSVPFSGASGATRGGPHPTTSKSFRNTAVRRGEENSCQPLTRRRPPAVQEKGPAASRSGGDGRQRFKRRRPPANREETATGVENLTASSN